MRLLDIGCGWGATALRARKHYGARVIGLRLKAAPSTSSTLAGRGRRGSRACRLCRGGRRFNEKVGPAIAPIGALSTSGGPSTAGVPSNGAVRLLPDRRRDAALHTITYGKPSKAVGVLRCSSSSCRSRSSRRRRAVPGAGDRGGPAGRVRDRPRESLRRTTPARSISGPRTSKAAREGGVGVAGRADVSHLHVVPDRLRRLLPLRRVQRPPVQAPRRVTKRRRISATAGQGIAECRRSPPPPRAPARPAPRRCLEQPLADCRPRATVLK
jgi:hypothetical protein